MTNINIVDENEDPFIAVSKMAYEAGLKDGRNESGLFAIIPMSILENKNLSANAKLLYGEIMALSKKSGKCYATNEYLADTLGMQRSSIPILLKELTGNGLVMVSIDRNSKGTYRDIVVSFFNDGGHRQKAMGGIVKQRGQKRNKQIEINKVSSNVNVADNELTKNIQHLIGCFKDINPSYKRLFANKTQRLCLARLINEHGVDKVKSILEELPGTNKLQYAPIITTPLELENKLGALIAFKEKLKNKITPKKLTFMGNEVRNHFGVFQALVKGDWLNIDPKYVKDIKET